MTYWTRRRRERSRVAAWSSGFDTMINPASAQLQQLQSERVGLSHAGSKRSPADALERGQQSRVEKGYAQ